MVLKFWYKLGHFKTGHVTIVCDRQMQLLQHVHLLHTMRHVSKTAKQYRHTRQLITYLISDPIHCRGSSSAQDAHEIR